MNLFGKTFLLGMLLMGSSSVMAEDCPIVLPYENLVDCIVEEASGGSYPVQQVLDTLNQQQAEAKQTPIDDGRSADEV